MQVDQDINCRTVGRCVYGAPIDVELGDMTPVDEKGNVLPLESDASRHFSYVRYNADLSQQALDSAGLSHIESDHVRQMDSVKYMDQLREVGKTTGKAQVKVGEHFKWFL